MVDETNTRQLLSFIENKFVASWMASSVHAMKSCSLVRNAFVRLRPQAVSVAAPLTSRSVSIADRTVRSHLNTSDRIRSLSSAPQLDQTFAKVSSVDQEASDDTGKDSTAPTRFRDVSPFVFVSAKENSCSLI